jgi:hypothetical protein
MAYTLQAIISKIKVLEEAKQQFVQARIVPLKQGLGLIPMTDQLIDEMYSLRLPPANQVPEGPEETSSPELAQFAQYASQWGVVALVEAEIWAGEGEQAASVWLNQQVIGGPWLAERGPINQALRQLGVDKGNHYDEFDAVGLGLHRSNDEWLEDTADP